MTKTNRNLSLLFILNQASCSFILTFFGNINEYLGTNAKYVICFILFFIGLYLAVYGVKYPKISLGIVITIILDSCILNIINKMQEAARNGDSFYFISNNKATEITEYLDKNPQTILIGILIGAIVIAFLIVSLIKAIFYIGLAAALIVIYGEIFNKKALLQFGVEDDLAQWIIFITIAVILFYLTNKFPLILLCIVFSIFGVIMIALTLEIFTDKDWGLKDALDNFNITDSIKVPEKTILVLFAFILFCFGIQSGLVFFGKA